MNINKPFIKKNIRLDYIFRALFSFAVCEGIFVLFLIKRGLPIWQIGLLEGVFHLTSILFEIPSGALADLWGRKWVMLASRVCSLLSTVIMLSTTDFWLLSIAFVFTALGYNLVSGSEEALVYDTLLQGGEEERFFKLNSRLSFVAEVSYGLALLAGGFLAEISYTLCYVISIGIDVISGAVCVFFSEPKSTEAHLSVKEHFSTAGRLLKDGKQLRFVLFHFSVLVAFRTAVGLYCQQFYYSRGLTESRIALLLLGASVCSSLGALLSERVSRVMKGHASAFFGGVCAAGIMLMASGSLALSLVGCAVSSMANAAVYPLQSNELNRLIPSAQRATLISVSSMCFSAVMIILFPLMGAVMEYIDMNTVFFGTGALLLLYTAVRFKRSSGADL